MKVLAVSTLFPYPPNDGDRLPVYHFLRCLAPQVQYTLLVLQPPEAEQARWNQGRRRFESWGIEVIGVTGQSPGGPRQMLRCLRHGVPWINRFFEPNLAVCAQELLHSGTWDVVQAEGILSAQHLPRRLSVGSVLVARDCLSAGHHGQAWRHSRRLRDWLQMQKIRSMERALYRRFDRILTISEKEKANILGLCPRARVGVIPNGVDFDHFAPRPGIEEPQAVVFTGAMNYGPNVDGALWLAKDIWPRVIEQRPEARLYIVGRDPLPEVLALTQSDSTITVTGTVPDMTEWLARGAVVVSPLRYGAGMKNKILEAAAMARPIVATPLSLDDIQLDANETVLIAETSDTFADRIVELLENPPRRRQLGDAALTQVRRTYAWPRSAQTIYETYQAVTS